MKYIAAVIFGFTLWVGSAFAADFSITNFHSDITINTDASISVVETIDINFPNERHGIFREIPFVFQTDAPGNNNGFISVPIYVQGVTNGSGQVIPFTTSQPSAPSLTIKIGDPKKTVTGNQRYVLTYRAVGAVSFFAKDELNWNVTGTKWATPVPHATATIHLPDQVPTSSIETACYTGSSGSTNQNCTATVNNHDVSYEASDFLTAVVGFAKGVIVKPSDYDEIRSNTSIELAPDKSQLSLDSFRLSSTTIIINLAGIVAAVIMMVAWWMAHGRDTASQGTVIAQYEPPSGMRPAEVGVLKDESADIVDVTATIIDLAVRGFLTIEEVTTKKLLGLKTDKGYILHKRKKTIDELKVFEKKIYDGLFEDGDDIELEELKNKFYTKLVGIKKSLYTEVTRSGYFLRDPDTVRKMYIGIGAVITVGFGVAMFVSGRFNFFALPIIGIVILIFSRALPKRSPKGVAAYWHCKGLKEFLHTAERYRLQWQEKEKIFETLLPYAMVLGVAKEWATTFKDIGMEPPSWYSGAPGSHLNSLALWTAMNSWSTTAARSLVAAPHSSGGSGLGGGGFSGGGFGGGGGGSW